MKLFFWLAYKSLQLDFKFLRISPLSMTSKSQFLLLKYFLLAKHQIIRFEIGRDYIKFMDKKIYYDSKFGLGDYQSVLTRHQNLINIAHITYASTIIDIGANVGFFSKLARQIYTNSNIYALEPIPQIFNCLQRNFEDDHLTKVFNLAASDIRGDLKMSFDATDSAISKIDSAGHIKVKAITLDEFISEHQINRIDILKIDTETFEDHVLRGASKALAITKYLFIEVTIKGNDNYTVSSLMSLLNGSKYDFQLIGFRNYSDKSEGVTPILDCLMHNVLLT